MTEKWKISSRLAEQAYKDREKSQAKQEELKKKIIHLLLQYKKERGLSQTDDLNMNQVKDALRSEITLEGSASQQSVKLRNFFRSAWGEAKNLEEINYIISIHETSEQKPQI